MANQITIDQRNFKYDYYSGANIGIFVGGNQLTDAVGFEMTLQQNKTPVYGYASSLYDGVANGVVQVSGTLWLNFTQAQLMSAFVANAFGRVDPTSLDVGASASEFLSAALGDDGATPIDLELISSYSDELKEQYWFETPDNLGNSRQEGGNLGNSAHVAHARPDQHLNGFDIWVTYGVPFQQSSNTNSTLRVVKDVRIVGFGQTISIDGEPIIEAYPFIAREVL